MSEKLPQTVGLPLDEACKLLQCHGLCVQVEYTGEATAGELRVIRQMGRCKIVLTAAYFAWPEFERATEETDATNG